VIRAAAAVALFAAWALAFAPAAAATGRPAPSPSPTPYRPFVCLPDTVDLDHPVVEQISDAQLAELVQSYHAPEIAGLRTTLDAAVAGTADDETKQTLQNVPHDLLADRFVLFSDERGLFGGFWLQLQFRDHPDTMYQVWIYGHGMTSRDGTYSVRTWQSAACSPKQQHWIAVHFGDVLAQVPGG
jgi:hypothetical protein